MSPPLTEVNFPSGSTIPLINTEVTTVPLCEMLSAHLSSRVPGFVPSSSRRKQQWENKHLEPSLGSYAVRIGVRQQAHESGSETDRQRVEQCKKSPILTPKYERRIWIWTLKSTLSSMLPEIGLWECLFVFTCSLNERWWSAGVQTPAVSCFTVRNAVSQIH